MIGGNGLGGISGSAKNELYRLTLSNLEEDTLQANKLYKEWSGNVSLTLGSGSNQLTIQDAVTTKNTVDQLFVDLTDPKVTAVPQVDISSNKATIAITVIDKYFRANTSITPAMIRLLSGNKVVSDSAIFDPANNSIEKIYATINGTNRQIGVKQTFTVNNLVEAMEENLILHMDEGAVVDDSGNKNKTTDISLFNCLVSSKGEGTLTSGFLGNARIARKDIQSVTFKSDLSGVPTVNNTTCWDVSVSEDQSIIAYYKESSAPYNIVIASANVIYANPNSSYLFNGIGYEYGNNAIIGLERLNTAFLVNATGMFMNCGYKNQTSLTLPNSFSTRNVKSMSQMFQNCGYTSMTSLTLGSGFITSKVTDMSQMFEGYGHNSVTGLSVSSFDTTKVTNMKAMFKNMGANRLKTLTLGNNFNTTTVTDMSEMFSGTGSSSTQFTHLDLGNNFNTTSVSNMTSMFQNCGSTALKLVEMGPKFTQIAGTNSNFATNLGFGRDNTIVYCMQNIYKDHYTFKLNSSSGSTISYSTGTINPSENGKAPGPVISANPESSEPARQANVTISVTAGALGGTPASKGQYYLSSSDSSLSGGSWTDFNNGQSITIGAGKTGNYYLYISTITDDNGRVSTKNGTLVTIGGKSYHRFGPYRFDNTAPRIAIDKSSATVSKSTNVTITMYDDQGSVNSGIASTTGKYYLSSSSNSLTGGAETNYTSGSAFTIGAGKTGTYYLFVKTINDKAGNSSNGDLKIGSENYHKYGPYIFDNAGPIVDASVTSYTPSSGTANAWKSANIRVNLTDQGNAGVNNTATRLYFLSQNAQGSSKEESGYYNSGTEFTIGAGKTGTYYLFVKAITDNLGNVSNTKGTVVTVANDGQYHRFGPYKIDNSPPTVSVSPSSLTDAKKSTTVTITLTDVGPAGLASTTNQQYYLTTNASPTTTDQLGSVAYYNSGSAFTIGGGKTGTYYLYVKSISDTATNTSVGNITIGGVSYHKYGPYKFDNTNPTVNLTVTEHTPAGNDVTIWKSAKVRLTEYDSGPATLSSNTLKYYFTDSDSKVPTSDSGWSTCNNNDVITIGSGITGTYYVYVKPVTDTASNVSTAGSYHKFGPYRFDNTAPTVTASPASAGWRNSALSVTVTYADTAGSVNSGIATTTGSYYLTTNSNPTSLGNATGTFTSGTAFSINPGATGTYYLYIPVINDRAGNESNANITIGGARYHKFGPYQFDKTNPTLTLGAQSNGTYVKSRNVSITIGDADSGLATGASIKYAWSTSTSTPSSWTTVNPSYTAGTKSVSFNATGNGLTGSYYLHVQITTLRDVAGNSYTTTLHSSGTFLFDNTAPTVSLEANSDTTWRQNRTVNVTIKDDHSGLATGTSIRYGWSTSNSTAPTDYATASISSYSTGAKTATFTAYGIINNKRLTGQYYLWVEPLNNTFKDVAGNIQTATAKSTGVFYFDNTAPTVGTMTMKLGSASGGAYGNNSWTNQSVYLAKNNGSDAHSGHRTTTYTVKNSSGSAIYTDRTDPVTLDPGTGNVATYTVTVTTTDNTADTANVSTSSTYTIKIDKRNPVISLDKESNGTWEKNQTVKISIADGSGESGISGTPTIKYGWTTDRNKEPSSYTQASGTSITATGNSSMTGSYYLWVVPVTAKDNAGNSAVIKVSTGAFNFDNTAPIAGTMTMKLGSSSGNAYSNATWTNQSVYIAVNNGSDAHSGHNSTTYTVRKSNGSTIYSNITSAVTLDPGAGNTETYTITITTTDNAGNTATRSYTVMIDKDAPTVSFSPSGNETWKRNHSTTVTITDNDGNIQSNVAVDYAWSGSGTSAPSSGWTTKNSGITVSGKSATFTISQGGLSGKYYLWIRTSSIKDDAGNTPPVAVSAKAFWFDNTAPTAGTMTMKLGSASGGNYTNDSWTNQSVYIAVNNGSDAHSGHKSTTYTVKKNGSVAYSNKTDPVTLNPGDGQEATYEITITTTDNTTDTANIATRSYVVKIDKIKPAIKYINTTIDKTNKIVKFTFEATDNHYSSGAFTKGHLTVRIKDENNRDITSQIERTVRNTEKRDSSGKLIGHTYEVELSGLEKLEREVGKNWADFSGTFSIGVQAGIIRDLAGNTNTAQTLTVGVSVPSAGSEVIADVVDPLWEKYASTINMQESDATATVTTTDKYYSTDKLAQKNIGDNVSDAVKLLVDGKESDATIILTSKKNRTETRNGQTVTVGADYGLSIKGFSVAADQVILKILAGTTTDKSGNTNKDTYIALMNQILSTATETKSTSTFLGIPNIKRENIQKVIFETSTASANGYTTYNAAAIGDKSIISWVTGSNPYTVHIASDDLMFANKNSSYLFSYIGSGSNCTATSVIENLNILNIGSVIDMKYMFRGTGKQAMTSLNLGNNFYTETVQDMSHMFEECGYNKMTSLELGTNFKTNNVVDMENMFSSTGYKVLETFTFNTSFNTQKVKDMKAMFQNFGHDKLKTLTFTSSFNTRAVTNMQNMFAGCGYSSTQMTTLNLATPAVFNTANVTNMTSMFDGCGYTSMPALNLGTQFNTAKVSTMDYMFRNCGYGKITTLDLGDLFTTSAVTDMTGMFNGCGYTSMTSLDLGQKFTQIPNASTNFATDCGKSGAVIQAPEAIYSNRTTFKKGPTSTATLAYNRGTLNVKYKPEWTKVSSSLSGTSLAIQLKGTTNSNYTSNVTSNLTTSDITVYVDGEEVGNAVYDSTGKKTSGLARTLSSANPKTGAVVTQTLTLTGLDQYVRMSGKNFTEWSGNVSIKIGGRGQATSTYSANKLVDEYGNQSMMETEQSGSWVSITFKDGEISQNTNGTMFGDFIKPEIRYEYSNTVIGNANNGNTKTVTVVFDMTDKYYNSTTMTRDNITVKFDNDATANSKVTKTLSKKTISSDQTSGKVTYKANGDIYYNGKKVGERYQLVVSNIQQNSNNGFDYSGQMTLAFDAGKITDRSGNTNSAKTITVGIDDPTNDANHNTGVTVDVVDPVWKLGTVTKNASTGTVTAQIIGTDKFYASNSLNADNITVTVDNENATSITKTLTRTGITNQQVTYNLELKNFEQGSKQTNKDFLEWSGTVRIGIPKGTLKDTSGNSNIATTFNLGHVDFIKPKIEYISATVDKANKTETIVFKVMDKYLKTTGLGTTVAEANNNKAKTKVYVDNNLADSVTKNFTAVSAITYSGKTIGYQYTLQLSGFDQGSRQSGKQYKEWSGTVRLDIDAGIITDESKDNSGGNSNEYKQMTGNFVDFIAPEITYVHGNGDIDYGNKTYTMVFDVTDKYFSNTKLTKDNWTNYLTVKIGDVDITTNSKVKKEIISIEDVRQTTAMNKTLSGTTITNGLTNQVIGKRFKLKLSNLEQVIKTEEYVDYSGVVTVALKQDVASDTSGNINAGQTITSGVNIPGGSSSSQKVVDVVDPLWEQVGPANAKPSAQTSDITLNITDKYFVKGRNFTANDIEVYVNKKLTTGLSVSITKVKDLTYGEQYRININGYPVNASQLGIKLKAGLFADQSGNTTKAQEFVLFSCLASTANENATDSYFLGKNKKVVKRADIEQVIFVEGINGANSTKWDVSESGDGSIMAWYTGSGPYKVYIGSSVIINGNIDSSYLFANLGRNTSSMTTDATTNPIVKNLSLVHLDSVTNMSYMFAGCGYSKMTGFKLDDSVDTTNVTNMEGMFSNLGYTNMTTMALGTKFNTTNVTNMNKMFENCGYSKLQRLELNINTKNVQKMASMFEGTGHEVMTTLNLGSNFITSNVTTMNAMFKNTGYKAMTSLDLGDNFSVNKVNDMASMFNGCGYTAMSTLDLGPQFTQIPATNSNFATNCGKSEGIIYAPESIYSKMNKFKLNSTSGTTIACSRSIINPVYKPEWTKTSGNFDATTGIMTVEISGKANKVGTPIAGINYVSTLPTYSVDSSKITVYVDDEKADSVVKEVVGPTLITDSSNKVTEVKYTIKLSGFNQTSRQSGKNFKEWSGNVAIQLAKGTLKDVYGNQNLDEIDINTSGTMNRIELKDSNVEKNMAGVMFEDNIKPEFTYEYSNTVIGNKKNGNTKTVTVVFDVTDKYFNSASELTADNITINIGNDANSNSAVKKVLTKRTTSSDKKSGNITYKANGDIYYNNKKIGERYQLVVSNIQQTSNDGFKYSGIMTVAFQSGKVTDKSGNANDGKSITIGIDDPANDANHNSGAIVDVVDPIWHTENININATNKVVTVDLVGQDKYYSSNSLTTDSIKIFVDGQEVTTTSNVKKTLSSAKSVTNGVKYTLTLSNWEETSRQSGKEFIEWSGTTKIKIAEGTLTDTSGNTSVEQNFTLGHVDFIKPKLFDVKTTKDPTSKTESIEFKLTDKYFDTTDALTADEIAVTIDDEVADTTNGITKKLVSEPLTHTVNGVTKTVGYKYTLTISDFEKARNSNKYKDWSGTVKIAIKEGAIKDTSGNLNELMPITADFVDFIKPDLQYVHQSSDINAENRSYTMKFNITDKYYSSGKLTLNDLTIKMTSGKKGSDGKQIYYDLIDLVTQGKINISLNADTNIYANNIKATNTSTGNVETLTKVIGHEYILTISNLEQLDIEQGENTLNYSGIITVAINGYEIKDTSNNRKDNQTITSGVSIPNGGSQTVVDVVRPIWRKTGTTVDLSAKTSQLIIEATDTYWKTAPSTATEMKNAITVWADGTDITSSVTVTASNPTALKEDRIVNGTTAQVQYGNKYTISVSGYPINRNQVKIRIKEGVLVDQSNNKNETSEFIIYNCLKETNSETAETSTFLGITGIQRQNIDNVTFLANLDTMPKTATSTTSAPFDVSARQDKSIMAWYTKNANNSYKVYIGSDDQIFGNQNSSYLFANIGRSSLCTSKQTITNLNLLYTINVINMNAMFYYTGANAMTGLTFTNNFDTRNVTNMGNMFNHFGLNKMTSFSLGDSTYTAFNTSNVTNMGGMFGETGQNAMTTLKLGDNFNTSKVLYMSWMFSGCGTEALTELNLGSKFDTSAVTTMEGMFNIMGQKKLKTLALGNSFNTSKVTDMKIMFQGTGGNSVDFTKLDLGDYFYTTAVTDMTNMFNGTGTTAMKTLDLGPAFTMIATTNFINNSNTGASGVTIYAPEAIYLTKNKFKLNTSSTTTINYTRGNINPIYRPEWTKLSSSINTTNKTMTVKVKGNAYITSPVNYASDVAGLLTANNLSVYVDGEKAELTTNSSDKSKIYAEITGGVTNNNSTGKKEVEYTITLSNFEQKLDSTGLKRQDGKNYKEWSGNVAIQIAKGILSDSYGNKSLAEVDTSGTMQPIELKNNTTETKNNTSSTSTMFSDFIKPEFTYIYADSNINHNDKTLTVQFSVVDKYFSTSTLTADQIVLKMKDDETAQVNSNVTKEFSKVEDVKEGTKVIGKKYTLVIKGLQQQDITNGKYKDYSGPMSISIPQNVVTDTSGNTNNSKTITIGINEPDQTGNQQIVDVVDPVWRVENLQKTVDSSTGKITATMDLYGTDKYYKSNSLTADKIQVWVDGVNITATGSNANITRTLTKVKDLTETRDGSTVTYGVHYKFTLSDLEETDEVFKAQRDKYTANSSTGRVYREYSGAMKLVIPAGTIQDNYSNNNKVFEVSLGHVDTLNPEVIKVSSSKSADNKKETFVFDVVDKYLKTSSISKTDTSKIHVLVDGEEATGATKTITDIQDFTATVNGSSQLVGKRYTLEITNLEQTRTSINYDREYSDWSGNIAIKIDAGTATDTSNNANNATTLDGEFIDSIKPNVTYQYATSDIDYGKKTFTMVFDITDKHYRLANLGINDLNIKIDGEDVDWNKVTKSLQVTDRYNTVKTTENGVIKDVSRLVGQRYTLTLTNLEQLQVMSGDNYLDYSGIITVAIPANKVEDTTGNWNNATTLTSGITVPGGSGSGQIVDVVDPLVERISSSANAINRTATVKFKVTDKYFEKSTITGDNLKVIVNGKETSGITRTLTSTALNEQKVSGSTTKTVQYGVEYTLTISGFAQDVNQVIVRVPEGYVTDTSKNGNKQTDLIVYNALKLATTESSTTSAFLGGKIQRQNIDNVTFERIIPSTIYDHVNKKITDTTRAWDVSAQGDQSIVAWYVDSETKNGVYKIHIANNNAQKTTEDISNSKIFANQNSAQLFSYIGYSTKCTSQETITNISLLETDSVTNMYRMFRGTGYNAMTKLDLGSNFNTINVTSTSAMFEITGYKAMTTLNLGSNFNTSNVTSMTYMFNECGFTAMKSLDLGTSFYTSKVTNMHQMFRSCGYTAMTSINLRNNFNTSAVTNMSEMFENCGYTAMTGLSLGGQFITNSVTSTEKMFRGCGYTAMTSLNLGNNFDTSAVTTMAEMFEETGYKSMTTLNLGGKFKTSKVESMYGMFYRTGREKMTSLDLGGEFDTSKVTNMRSMFNECGYTSMTTLNLGEKFNTSSAENMYRMFYSTGHTAMTSLDLGNKFYTTTVTDMTEMFNGTGTTAMTKLDLGPAFTQIAETHDNIFTNCGTTNLTIYAPEAVYSSIKSFKNTQ